jgi:hypothetical protein
MSKGHIYLVNMADLINNVYYKIGKSININKRIKKYDYGNIINFMKSDNIDYDESQLLKIFNKNCTLDKGREYFKCESDEFILELFINYFVNKIKKNKKGKKSNIKKEKITEIQEVQEVQEVQDVQEDQEEEFYIDYLVNEDINNMEDRTCTNCDKTFIYPSELKKHFKNIKLKCNNCNTLFVQKSSLTRHMNTSKCNKENKERQKK